MRSLVDGFAGGLDLALIQNRAICENLRLGQLWPAFQSRMFNTALIKVLGTDDNENFVKQKIYANCLQRAQEGSMSQTGVERTADNIVELAH